MIGWDVIEIQPSCSFDCSVFIEPVDSLCIYRDFEGLKRKVCLLLTIMQWYIWDEKM